MMRSRLALGLFLSLLGTHAFGVIGELGDLYEDPRSLGMGRANTAVVDDYTSLYYNPAGLSLIDEWKMNGFLTFDGDFKIMGLVSDIKAASGKSDDANKNQSFQEAMNILSPYRNQNIHGRFGLGAYWVWSDGPFFLDDMGGGFNFQIKLDPSINENLTDIRTRALADAHLVTGKSQTFFPDESLRVGADLKFGYRVSIDQILDLVAQFNNNSSSTAFDKNSAKERVWIDTDAGVQYDIPFMKQFRPRVGVAVLNILNQQTVMDTNLVNQAGDEVILYTRRVNVGVSSGTPRLYIFEPTFSFDIKDMGVYTPSFWNRIHIGAELKFIMFEWWKGAIRGGFDQGYFTAGVYGKLSFITLDLVYYAREMGAFPGQNANHRFLFQLGWEI